MKNIIVLTAIVLLVLSCKKEVGVGAFSEVNQKMLQGNWVQDSSWTYSIATENNQIVEINGVTHTYQKDDSIVSMSNYTPQNFSVNGSRWTNLTSNWSQDLEIYEEYILIGGTRYNIDALTPNRFVLTRIPHGEFTNSYTRWFSR